MNNLKTMRVLVTPTSYGRHNPGLKEELESSVDEVIYNTTGKPLSSQQVAELLPGIDGYIAGLDYIDRSALAFADKLKVIARYGVGIDRVDLTAATQKDIIVTNTPGANSASVAELALTMMLMLARQIPVATQELREGEWPRLNGLSLEEKIIGIIGLGAIGKHLAKRLASFNCKIIAYDPYPDNGFAEKNSVGFANIDDVITSSDFISLHLPVLDGTRHFVNASFLDKMKTGAFLINTSRGEIVDESALILALKSGKLGGAGIDAFAKEPPDADNPLLSMPNVVCTPHIGAHTDGATNNMGRMALVECLRVLEGKEPKFRVN